MYVVIAFLTSRQVCLWLVKPVRAQGALVADTERPASVDHPMRRDGVRPTVNCSVFLEHTRCHRNGADPVLTGDALAAESPPSRPVGRLLYVLEVGTQLRRDTGWRAIRDGFGGLAGGRATKVQRCG